VTARGLSLLALAQLAIGAAAIFARFALAGGGPLSVSAMRLLLASVPLCAVAFVRGAYRRIDGPTERRLLIAGLALAVHFGTWIASLNYASVAVSTLLVCSTPIFTELYAVVRARRIRLDALASIALGLAGVAIIGGRPSSLDHPLGIALALAGAIAMAVYLTLVRASDKRYRTIAIVGRTYPVAMIALSLSALVSHDPLPPLTDGSAWAGIAAMALISQLFGHTALNAALRTLRPTFVATVTLIEPAIAAGLAALIFHESVPPATILGATVILGAIAVAIRAESREPVVP
jgi:drug/metabolite transporter (DMT)-like permease